MRGIIINGSPKGVKSGSLKLAKAFAGGMGMEDMPVYHISGMEVRPCSGCFGCWKTTPGTCVIHDDMSLLLEELKTADYIIWSFPLYYFSVPGMLKNVIDRQLPLIHPFMEENHSGGSGSHASRYDRSHQRHILISTCGFFSAENNYQAVYEMFDHMLGKGKYDTVFCGQGELFQIPQLSFRTDEYLNLVAQAGREFRSGKIKEDTEAKLQELLFPKDTFEEMADASWGLAADSAAGKQEVTRKGYHFTRQMAALYNPLSFDGQERIVEFCYTDLDETYQIRLGQDGHQVSDRDFVPYTTRIETPFTVWQAISLGEISGSDALAMHKYRVLGDFDLMIHWDEFFYGSSSSGKDTAESEKCSASRPSTMKILLAPWLIIWIVLSFQPYYGAIAGLVLIGILPFAWSKYEATVYEYISIFAGSVICLMAVIGISETIWRPASYLCFGLMWSVSVLLPVPLTAYYSCRDYGGRSAFRNMLFIQTNRILTACWGVLYLITGVWTWVLLRNGYGGHLVWLNQLLPVALGFFTVWFQKWYPAKVAANG